MLGKDFGSRRPGKKRAAIKRTKIIYMYKYSIKQKNETRRPTRNKSTMMATTRRKALANNSTRFGPIKSGVVAINAQRTKLFRSVRVLCNFSYPNKHFFRSAHEQGFQDIQ